MEQFAKRFKIECSPVADKNQVYVNGNTRLTVITPCMLRVENQADGKFCDEPTQSVWFRDFCKCDFETKESGGTVEIKTSKATFVYSLKSKKMLRILLADGRKVTNYKAGNLKGTCRTLDITAGIITLNDGVCSRGGVAVLDDGKTLAIKPDGSILPRENKETDKYYFAYGNDYIGATTDLYQLTGKVPLIPDMLFQTGGADTRHILSRNILTLWINSRKKKCPLPLQRLIWTGTGLI